MPINNGLLIASPTLQDALIDNATGLPLANGTVTLYDDNSRTTLKPWYYLTGSPGSYTFITLPNPMTLSSVGTITDGNGNDVIPFFYPYESDNSTWDPYYIVVTNSNGQQQFTRQDFPYNTGGGAGGSGGLIPGSGTSTLDNLLTNNVFWRNINSISIGTGAPPALTNKVYINSSTSYFYTTLAPSQHDGFSMPDIIFLKDNNTATETLTFTQFTTTNALPNDITPEFYLNYNCTGAGSGEAVKCIQIPISFHVNSLAGATATVVVQAQNVASSPNGTLVLALNQFLGTGQPVNVLPAIATIPLSNGWIKYAFKFTFPLISSVTSLTNDSAYYLQIQLPLNATSNINIAKPAIYLSAAVPTNDFETYDQVDSITNTPRTGDIRVTLNNFFPYGWIQMADGSIGSAGSSASPIANRSPATWQLYNLLWNNIGVAFAPMVDGNPYGADAYTDFSTNRAMYLTKQLGRVLAGAGLPSSGTNTGTTWEPGQNTGNELHTMLAAELAPHDHAPSNAFVNFTVAGSGSIHVFTPDSQVNTAPLPISSAGSATPFNIQNPVAYYNIFIKL